MPLLLLLLLTLPVSFSVHAGELDPIITQSSSEVTQQDFDARISRIPQKDRLPFLRDGGRVEMVLRKMMLDKRLADEARLAGFDKKPLVELRLQLAMETELADAWLDSVEASKVDVADFELMAKEYYQTHPQEFKQPASVDVAHILIAIENRSDAAALELANKVYSQLSEDSSHWDELVLEHSDDPGSKGNSGKYLGVVPGKMVKPFEIAAFALQQVGDISQPVKTIFGYHVIRLDAKNAAATIPFVDVKLKLIHQQRSMYTKKARTEYLSSINTADDLIIPDCAIEEMMARYFDDEGVQESWRDCLAKKGG